MTLNTWDELKDLYYRTNECRSDDPDSEWAAIEQWAIDNGHKVFEDDPQKEVDRENARAIGIML